MIEPTSLKPTRRSSPREKCFSISFCSVGVSEMPGGSLNWIRTTSGSVGCVVTWTPASYPSILRRCRLTAAGSTRRSATLTPAAVSPVITARLIIRHAGDESRLATTREPFLSAVPSAVASRIAVSGVRSTSTRPDTPHWSKSRDDARDSQIRLSWISAPDSISLYG